MIGKREKMSKYTNKKGGWFEFLALCAKIKSAEEFGRLFDLFFTIEEKETLRVLAAKTEPLTEKE